MNSRGQSWYAPGSLYHTSGHPPPPRDRDDPYMPNRPGQGHPLPADPRGMGHQWYSSPDPWYDQSLISSPPRPELISGHSQGSRADWARPHSRQAYDYPPQSYHDYREDHSYYDHGYYTEHYGYPDASGWHRQGSWRAEGYQNRGLEQGWMGATYTDQYGYGLRRDGGLHDCSVSRREQSDEYEDGGGAKEVWDSEALARSKTSGLSSSSYELSQYINGSEQTDTVPASHLEPEAEPKVQVPLKFCLPHVSVSFGPAGQLVRVSPTLASQGEPAQVEIHSLEVILSDTCEQNDMRNFPGPLVREDLHKVDIINFALQMADACLKDDTAVDASSAALLWHLLVLQCRQNGRIIGSDIAELLMQDCRSVSVCDGGRDMGSLIDLSETPTAETESLNAADLLTGNPLSTEESKKQGLENYTRLLLEGRKKEALEMAMRSSLWGHALFLASKMDGRTYTGVLSRFTGSLVPSDPLQTLFQLLSGRVPVVATSYNREKWGDWKPHLAVVLSNDTGDSDIRYKFLCTMGDTLASRGLLHAAHICYIIADSPFGWYTNRTHRLVLLGSTQTAPLAEFCQNSSIRCTEVLEFCRRLGHASYMIPSFQVYKFLYACRLLDWGLTSQAFHYCEGVARALLSTQQPHSTLLEEVIKLADRLKHSEAQLRGPGSASADPDPAWLVLLQRRFQALQMGDTGSLFLPEEDRVWSSEKSEEHADLDSDILLTTAQHTSHNGADEDLLKKLQSVTQSYPLEENSPPSYPSEENSCPSYPSEEQSYTTAAQTYDPDGQLPQPWAPVPVYQPQNTLAVPPEQFWGKPGFPLVAAGQIGTNHVETSHHPNTTGLVPGSVSDMDVGFSPGANMMDASENAVALGAVGTDAPKPPEAGGVQGINLTTPGKASKSGWFSGWFRSKPKETTQDQNKQADPGLTTPDNKSTIAPSFPSTCPPGPVGPPPSSFLSQSTAASTSPFSRRAGQKPGVTMAQNFGSMSNVIVQNI